MSLPKGTAQTHSFWMRDTNGAGVTGKTVTATISKDGGAFAVSTNPVVEVGSGAYKLSLTAAERTADEVVINYTDGVVAGVLIIYPSTTDVASIKAKTDNLPSDPADESLLEAAIAAATPSIDLSTVTTPLGVIDGIVDAIKLKTDNLPSDPADESLLEAAISAIPTGSAPSASTVASAVRTELSTELGRVDAAVSSRLAASGYTAPANADITAIKGKTDNLPASPAATGAAMTLTSAYDKAKDDVLTPLGVVDGVADAIKAKTDSLPTSPAAAGDAMALTIAERSSTALAIEQHIINETDGAAVLQAITDKIASVNPSLDDLTLSGIASAVRSELTLELGRLDAAISSRLAASGYTAPANSDVAAIKAKTDNLPTSPAATGDIPTANITAIKGKTDNLPATPASKADADAATSAANAAKGSADLANRTAPDNAGIAAVKAKTDNLPATPAAVGSAMTLTSAYDHAKDNVLTPLATVDGIVDAIKAKTDNLPTDPADQSLVEAAISAATPTIDFTAVLEAIAALPDGTDVSGILSAISDLNDFDPAHDTVAHVALVDTTTTNSDMRGTNGAVTSLAGLATENNATANKEAVLDAVDDVGAAVGAIHVDLTPVLDAIELLGAPAQEAALDALSSLVDGVYGRVATLGDREIVLQSPVTLSGALTVYAGDAYEAGYGRAITFTVPDTAHIFDLDSPDVPVQLRTNQATWEASHVVPTVEGYVVTFEPTSAETSVLTQFSQKYKVAAVYTEDGEEEVITFCMGVLHVKTNIPEL